MILKVLEVLLYRSKGKAHDCGWGGGDKGFKKVFLFKTREKHICILIGMIQWREKTGW